MIKDYIANLPSPVIDRVILEDVRVSIPTEINIKEFRKEHEGNIFQEELTTEKAIYVSLLTDGKDLKPVNELLYHKGR